MNKKLVDEYIPLAYEALEQSGIVHNGTVEKAFRGQISTFGAAISMGSLLGAVSFFADKGSAKVDRTLLLKAIHYILDKKRKEENNQGLKEKSLFDYVQKNPKPVEEKKEEIISASIALKLAMNLYILE